VSRRYLVRSTIVGCAVLLLLAGCTSIEQIDGSKLPTISATQAQSEPAKWEEIGKRVSAGEAIVITMEAGQKMPLKLSMLLPMAELVPGQNEIVFTRDTYLLIAPTRFCISPDGQRWVAINDFQAQKELFGFEQGTLSMGFQGKKGEAPHIAIDFTAK
jgi:hypothetical protein